MSDPKTTTTEEAAEVAVEWYVAMAQTVSDVVAALTPAPSYSNATTYIIARALALAIDEIQGGVAKPGYEAEVDEQCRVVADALVARLRERAGDLGAGVRATQKPGLA